jgi:hypothetical protein
MSLAVLVRVFVDEAVDTSGTESSCCDTLALFTSPRSGGLAATEGLDSSSDNGGFGSLLPLRLALAAAASAPAARI